MIYFCINNEHGPTRPRGRTNRTLLATGLCLCQNIQEFCIHGWPDKAKLYLQVASDLAIQNGLLLMCSRRVIPVDMKKTALENIHDCPRGIAKCRERAKQSVRWSCLSKRIEELVENAISVRKRHRTDLSR